MRAALIFLKERKDAPMLAFQISYKFSGNDLTDIYDTVAYIVFIWSVCFRDNYSLSHVHFSRFNEFKFQSRSSTLPLWLLKWFSKKTTIIRGLLIRVHLKFFLWLNSFKRLRKKHFRSLEQYSNLTLVD